MIGIVDYGVGNVKAFLNIYRRLGIQTQTVRGVADLVSVDRIILPGVGSFDWAMERLEASGLRDALNTHVMDAGKPVLGVCVGMQMMFPGSDEGRRKGLGWINGRVRAFEGGTGSDRLRLPHMGWNDVRQLRPDSILASQAPRTFYFLHSYFCEPVDAASVIGQTHYGVTFASVVQQGHIFGIQCHPEKSHQSGIELLQKFAGGVGC